MSADAAFDAWMAAPVQVVLGGRGGFSKRECLRVLREAFLAGHARGKAEEAKEHGASFDLRWNADQRAIKLWQEATGRTLVWPDHADLCVWLLGELDKSREKEAR